MKSMLGNNESLLQVIQGPIADLLVKLNGETGEEILNELKKFNRKEACWVTKNQSDQLITIDCGINPKSPSGFEISSHSKKGVLKLNISATELYLSKDQKKGKEAHQGTVRNEIGNDQRLKLEGRFPLNANVLDFLLKQPELIPEEWKGKRILFWGTIFQQAGIKGDESVACIYWLNGKWNSDLISLTWGMLSEVDFAAISEKAI